MTKETRHVVSRVIPYSAFTQQVGVMRMHEKEKIINAIKEQMARECVEIVMEKMEFIEDQSAMTQDVTIRGVVHIMSEHERMEIGSQKGITGPTPATAEEIARAGGRELPSTWTKAEYEQYMSQIKLNAEWPEISALSASSVKAAQEEANRRIRERLSNPPLIVPATNANGPNGFPPFTPGIWAKKLAEPFSLEEMGMLEQTKELDAEAFSKRQEQNNREDWTGSRYTLTTRGELIMSEKFWETGARFEGEPDEIKKLPPVTVLIDGDIVAYRCAATCDGRHYTVDGQRFGYKKDAVAHADKQGIPNTEIDLAFEPEPIDAALHNINVTMDNIKNYFIYEKKLNPQIKTFLSAARNFRYDVYPEYKKSRKTQRKPHWIKECKEFLQKQHDAFLFEGYEADDLIAMTTEALRGKKAVVIASCDKDFTQLGGEMVTQYDFTTGKEWAVSKQQAMQYFYKQLLMGDKSDDIPGIPKVGPQTALKILSGIVEERALYNTVVLAYKDKMNLSTEEAVEAVDLRGKLLYLLREEGKLWTPPPPRTLKE